MSSEDVRNNGAIHPEIDFPGFEYELEENVSMSSRNSQLESPGMPRFEDFRHPNVKLFVLLMGLLCNVALFVQGFRNVPRQHSRIICSLFQDPCDEDDPSFSEYWGFALQFSLEMCFPLSFCLSFVFLQLAIQLVPATAFRFSNPIPSMVPAIAILCFFYSITSFLSSISLLPSLATTSRFSVWTEYLTNTALGLFWMYSLLNIFAFSQLTIHSFIRAQEKYQMQNNALEAA